MTFAAKGKGLVKPWEVKSTKLKAQSTVTAFVLAGWQGPKPTTTSESPKIKDDQASKTESGNPDPVETDNPDAVAVKTSPALEEETTTSVDTTTTDTTKMEESQTTTSFVLGLDSDDETTTQSQDGVAATVTTSTDSGTDDFLPVVANQNQAASDRPKDQPTNVRTGPGSVTGAQITHTSSTKVKPATEPTSETSSLPSSTKVGIGIGSTCGAAVLIFAIFALVMWCRRRRRNQADGRMRFSDQSMGANGYFAAYAPSWHEGDGEYRENADTEALNEKRRSTDSLPDSNHSYGFLGAHLRASIPAITRSNTSRTKNMARRDTVSTVSQLTRSGTIISELSRSNTFDTGKESERLKGLQPRPPDSFAARPDPQIDVPAPSRKATWSWIRRPGMQRELD